MASLFPAGAVAVEAPDTTGAFLYAANSLRSLTSADFTFAIQSGTDLNRVSIYISRTDPHTYWDFEFEALPGEVLTTGTYSHAANSRFSHVGLPGFSGTGEGRGCSNYDTDFTINELVRDGAGNVTSFSASFTKGCEYAMANGEIRFHSTDDLYAWDYSLGPVSAFVFGDVVMPNTSAPASVIFTNHGTQPIGLGAEVRGASAGNFGLTDVAGCLGEELQPGTTCELQATFTPTGRGQSYATLSFWDGYYPAAIRPDIDVSLSGNGMQMTYSHITSTSGAYPVGVTALGSVDPSEAGSFYFAEDGYVLVWRQDVPGGSVLDISPGPHTITSNYAGSSTFVASSSNPLVTTVPFLTTTSLAFTPTNATAGQLIELYASVKGVGSYLPSGGTLSIVDLSNGSTLVSTQVTLGNWEARTTTRIFEATTGQFEARYSGHGLAAPSSASAAIIVANAPGQDSIPPNGSVVINGDAEHATAAAVTLTESASDQPNGSGVGSMSLSASGQSGSWTSWEPFASTRFWTLTGPDGVKTVFVRYRDWAGNVSQSVSDSIVLDRLPPSVTAPAVALAEGGQITSTVPLVVSFTATDVTSGVGSRSLGKSSNSGWTYTNVALGNGSSVVVRLAPGSNGYRFRSSAIDEAGNATSWQFGHIFSLARLQEKAAQIGYSGRWTKKSNSNASGGAYRQAGASGARAVLSFSGTSVGLVARVGPGCGRAALYVDGAYRETIDLYAATAGWRRIVGTTALSAGAHTMEVRVLHTKSAPSTGYRVILDAFVVVQ